jgi:hypothetical protein
MSDNRRTRLVAIALAVTLVASVLAGGAIVAAQEDGNETANETATENETLGEDEANETDGLAGENETADNETDDDNETDGLAGENETMDEETAAENETDAAADGEAADNETAAETDIPTQETAHVRFVHAAPEVDSVEVTVDNETVASNVSYGGVSQYLPVEAGNHTVDITTTDGENLIEQNVTLERGTATTVVVAENETQGLTADEDTPAVGIVALQDNALQPADDEAVLSVTHFSTGLSDVEVTIEGENADLPDNLSYGNATDYVTLPAGEYTIEFRDADADGEPRVTQNVTLDGGTAYTHFILGYLTSGSPDFVTTEDATTSVNLPSDGGAMDAAMNETEDEDAAMNETEDEGAEMNETENETEGLNETENETDGLNETANETMGEEGNESLGGEDNESVTDGNETGEAEADESENETARLAP